MHVENFHIVCFKCKEIVISLACSIMGQKRLIINTGPARFEAFARVGVAS
jgi:hypothetical protein